MVLVTGGTGLTRRELVRRLRQQGIQGRVQSRKQANTPRELWIGNITNPEAVEAAVRGVELVYHLAARVDHFASSAELYQTNVPGTAHAGTRGHSDSRIIHDPHIKFSILALAFAPGS